MIAAARKLNPAVRGYAVLYRENETNHCPGCGRTHWYVGRVTAECGFCSTALPLKVADRPAPTIIRRGKPFGPLAMKIG